MLNNMPLLVLESAPGGEVTLPEGFNIATAGYAYSGTDLVLTATNGATAVVRDFLSGANPPALATPQGARLGGETALRLAGVRTGTDVSPLEPIGQVVTVSGSGAVIHANGVREELAAGSPLFPGDILESDAASALGIVLADETTFAMAGGGRMIIEEAAYDPETQTGNVALTVLYGSYTFVSGLAAKSNPDAVTIRTLVADVNLHNAQAGIAIADGAKLTVAIMENAQGELGEVMVSNDAGTYVLDLFNQYLAVGGFNSLPADISSFGLGQLYAFFAGSLRYLPLSYNDGNDYGAQQTAAAIATDAPSAFVTDAGGETADETIGFIKVAGEYHARDDGADAFTVDSSDAVTMRFDEPFTQSAVTPADRRDDAPQDEVDDATEPTTPPAAGDDVTGDGGADGSVDEGGDAGGSEDGGEGGSEDGGEGGDDEPAGKVVTGGKGDDELYGGAGDDRLEGGKGDDELYGGPGDDRLAGGKGNDTFVFKTGDGEDVVTDFKIGDVLRFEGEEFSLDNISFTQDGKDTVITFDGNPDVEVTVSGVDADSLKGYSTTEIDTDAVIVRMGDLD